jgi:DHA3 family macrolide efflux protein-like MFS transporter
VTVCTVQLPHEERQIETSRAAGIPSMGGLRYIFARPGLRNLILVFFAVNLVMVVGLVVIQPMVLARTDGNTTALAAVTRSTGIGAVAGGLLLAARRGPKSMVRGMMLGIIAMCASAEVLTAVLRGPIAWCVTLFAGSLLLPIVNGTLQTLIQLKVPQEILGPVFGAVQFTTRLSTPAAMAAAGPLADHLFLPWAQRRSGLVGLLQHVTGSGVGSGLAVMLLLAGACGIAAAIWGLASRTLRNIDAPLTLRAETTAAATSE